MKFLAAACLVLAASSTRIAAADPSAQPSTVVLEDQNFVIDRDVRTDLNGTVVKMIHGPLGAYGFFYVDAKYAEALAGPVFAPAKWLAIGASAGYEQTGSHWRVGGLVRVDFGRYVSTTLIETGASGLWGREEFAWKPRSWIGLGALLDLGVGYGPRVEIDIPKLPIQVWGAALYDKGGGKADPAFGVRLDL